MSRPMSPNAMDTLTVSCFAVAAGALPANLLPIAVRIAEQLPDRCFTPAWVEQRLESLGIRCHREVWPLVPLADAYPKLTRRCRWALVWLEPDERHDSRWWSILHRCDDGSMSVTYLVDADPDRCFCRELLDDWTGHAVVVDHMPAGGELEVPSEN